MWAGTNERAVSGRAVHSTLISVTYSHTIPRDKSKLLTTINVNPLFFQILSRKNYFNKFIFLLVGHKVHFISPRGDKTPFFLLMGYEVHFITPCGAIKKVLRNTGKTFILLR